MTNELQIKNIYNKQKHASWIIYNNDKFTHAKPLVKSLNAQRIPDKYFSNINFNV